MRKAKEKELWCKMCIFSELIKVNIDEQFIKFIKKSNIKELNYYQLKCKNESSIGDTIKSPERVLQFLSCEINRRIQNRILWVSFILSLFALIVSIIALLKKW